MEETQFIFMDRPSSWKSKKEKELQISQIRAHAATVSHRRRRQSLLLSEGCDSPIHKSVPFISPPRCPLSPPASPEADFFSSDNSSLPCSKYFPRRQSYHILSPPGTPEEGQDPAEISNIGIQNNNTDDILIQHQQHDSPPFSSALVPASHFPLHSNPIGSYRSALTANIPHNNDPLIPHVVDFYTEILTPNNDLVCELFNVTNVYARFLEGMEDENFMHAGVAVVQTIAEQIRDPGCKPSQSLLMHKGRAIAKVRRKLSGPNARADDITLLAMVFLATLERAMGDPAAFALHRKNLALMAQARGGLQALKDGSLVKGTLMTFDSTWAFQTGDTIFPSYRRPHRPVYPTHPLPPPLVTLIDALPLGLAALALESRLSLDVLAVLARALDAGLGSSRPSAADTAARGARRKELRRYNDYWESCPCLGVPDGSGTATLERAVSLTMLVYCVIGFGTARSATSAFRGARAELSRVILGPVEAEAEAEAERGKSVAEKECSVWMALVAVDSWRVGAGRTLVGDGCGLVSALRRKIRSLGITAEWQSVESVLRQFFWTEGLNAFWRDAWAEVVGEAKVGHGPDRERTALDGLIQNDCLQDVQTNWAYCGLDEEPQEKSELGFYRRFS